MIFNPQIFTAEEVQEILDGAKASLKAGQSITSWTSLGSSATMTWAIHPLVVIKEATLYFQMTDPDTYGRPVKTARILNGC